MKITGKHLSIVRDALYGHVLEIDNQLVTCPYPEAECNQATLANLRAERHSAYHIYKQVLQAIKKEQEL